MKRLSSVWIVVALLASAAIAPRLSTSTAAQREDTEATASVVPTEVATRPTQAATNSPSFPRPTPPVLEVAASPTTIAPGIELLYY